MKVQLHHPEEGGVEVWVTVDDPGADAVTDMVGFCLGAGHTKDEAIADALQELGAAIIVLDQLKREATK